MSTPKNPTSPKSDDYADIINLPRPISKAHPHMDKKSRAAQFAPYAALVGHRDIIAGEEEHAFAKDNLDHEITIELDPETLELTKNPELIDFDEKLEGDTDFDFNQENPLDS